MPGPGSHGEERSRRGEVTERSGHGRRREGLRRLGEGRDSQDRARPGVGGIVSPPGKDQGAVGQDAHLSQILEGPLRVFLGREENQNERCGRKQGITILGCQEPSSQLTLPKLQQVPWTVLGSARTQR